MPDISLPHVAQSLHGFNVLMGIDDSMPNEPEAVHTLSALSGTYGFGVALPGHDRSDADVGVAVAA